MRSNTNRADRRPSSRRSTAVRAAAPLLGSSKARDAALRATRALAPVVVRFGSGLPRFSAFCDSVVENADGVHLILKPIAAECLPESDSATTICIHSTSDASPWSLRVRDIRPLGPDSASVRLADATLLPETRSRARDVRREPLTLIVPGNLDNVDVHVFPIVDVGASHCSVETSIALDEGQHFQRVEIHGTRRVLRRCAASVVNTTPWYTPTGAKRFRSRLAFRASEKLSAPGRVYDLVTEVESIRKVLEVACQLKMAGWYEAASEARNAVQFEALGEASVRLTRSAVSAPTHIRIGFELFTVGYEIEVRVLSQSEHSVDVALPLWLRRRQWRSEQRVIPPELDPVQVSFVNPGSGSLVSRRIVDLSFGGMCFEVIPEFDVLWEGLPLELAELTWRGHTVSLGDMDVRALEVKAGKTLCHTMLRTPSNSKNDYVTLLAALRHPHLRTENGDHFDSVLNLHRSVGLFHGFMDRNFLPVQNQAKRTWQNMHRKSPETCRTWLQLEDDNVVSVVTTVRAYERSWTAQHMSASPTRKLKALGALDLAYTEHIVSRADAHYTAMWVPSGNARQTEFLGRFLDLTGTGEAGDRRPLTF
ncbi:MAG: hypothetical protein IPK60_08700 [Sandaracinaceae bacterium]|nr:hypothetical protein [Sandaracinaceae bacterium]